MRSYDYFWQTNHEWWEYNDNLVPVLRSDAPAEAKESYQRYRKQKEEAHKEFITRVIIDEFSVPKYKVLKLDYEKPDTEYNAYLINGKVYDIVPMYDVSSDCIAIESSDCFIGQSVEFIFLETTHEAITGE